MIYKLAKLMTIDEAEKYVTGNFNEERYNLLNRCCTFGLALNFCRFGIAFMICLFGQMISLCFGVSEYLGIILFSPIIHIGLCILLFGRETKRWYNLNTKIHNEYMTRILTSIFGECNLTTDKITNYEIWRERKVLPYGNRQYNGKNLICKDFTLEQWRIKDEHKNSDGETKIVTRFEGYILNKSSNINISKPVRIITSQKNLGIEMKDNFPGRSDIESKVDVENIRFNNEFEVYTESPQDAFYVISPYVTEQLLNLKTLCRDFQCVVTNTSIYLAVDAGKLPLSGMIILKEGQTSRDTDMFKNLSSINKIATDIAIYLAGGVL